MHRGRTVGAATLVAAITAGGLAVAHSWSPGLVVGRFDKSSLHCDANACTADVVVERAVHLNDGVCRAHALVEVTASSTGEASDRWGGEHWSNSRDAFLHLADKEGLWLIGNLETAREDG